ncbi:MAG: UbiA family prenyltransferase, partial [Ilumatobacter sp.]|nr:UbiA family prenyltransferase [Ilumatobacter sp.]
FGIAAVAGLALAIAVGWELVAVGVAAIAAGWFYTGGSNPYGYLGLGEVFVFVFFGLVATVGSAYVQPAGWSSIAWLGAIAVGALATAGTTFAAIEDVTGLAIVMGCVAGCLACALLVINNLRDIPTDRVAGKRTLAVRLGDRWTRRLYVLLLVATAALVVAAAAWRPWVLLGLVAFPLAIGPTRVVQRGATGGALIAVLGATGTLQLAVGAATTVGLAIGA